MPTYATTGDHPLVGALILEGDQEDALVGAEAEAAVRERDLLGSRAEQQRDEALPLVGGERDEPLEHALEVGEEAGLALLDADQGRIAVRRRRRRCRCRRRPRSRAGRRS